MKQKSVLKRLEIGVSTKEELQIFYLHICYYIYVMGTAALHLSHVNIPGDKYIELSHTFMLHVIHSDC